jgi:hypothetical protein
MHGMTKEIHRAIRASLLEERDLPSLDQAASELAYRKLLRALQAARKVHTRIVVDAIAGSSAGGINGIFLAKALAHDLNQAGCATSGPSTVTSRRSSASLKEFASGWLQHS